MTGLIIITCAPLLLVVGLKTLAILGQVIVFVIGTTWPWLVAIGVLVAAYRLLFRRW
jgi:hypothetical protein